MGTENHGWEGTESVPETAPNQYLAIARIARPQGRHGEVVADILTDFPERFEKLHRAYLENAGGESQPVDIEKTWPHKGRIVLKFAGVDSINQADSLRGLHVFIRSEDRVALPEHQYYVWELEGCRVVRERAGVAEEVGIVTEIERTGGVDLLRVARARDKSRELLIPLTQDICTRIDTAAKMILIEPPEDLLELNS
ncbi:MAG: ribosome maturation factor RimM [Terriglobia bacterium]